MGHIDVQAAEKVHEILSKRILELEEDIELLRKEIFMKDQSISVFASVNEQLTNSLIEAGTLRYYLKALYKRWIG